MIIIAYQILTEHRERFSRWKSYKAYAILNGLEIVFWGAVIFLIIQANIKSCVGISCTLRWIAVVVSIVITYVSPALSLHPLMCPLLFCRCHLPVLGMTQTLGVSIRVELGVAEKEARMLT